MQLKRFREYVANNGNPRKKLERVVHFVLDRFRSTRSNNLPVHDIDEKRWTLSQAKIENIDGFKASDHWLFSLKKRNGISSRKVTKFVSHREVVTKSIIKQTADEFVTEATKHIPKYNLDFVLNADQSSFNYEMASNRTLSYAGEKATYLAVKSLNAISHPYTVMPTTSAAGQLLSPLFICLQESTGRFPFTKAIFSAPNIVTSGSTSGKRNTFLVEYWIREVLDKIVSNRFLRMVDQWLPQVGIAAHENNLTKGQSCKSLVIPRRARSTKQPCDTYFFLTMETINKKNVSPCITRRIRS